jgi:hypothetical protein
MQINVIDSLLNYTGNNCTLLLMRRLDKCLHLYIGCDTNKGQLIGIIKQTLIIQASE